MPVQGVQLLKRSATGNKCHDSNGGAKKAGGLGWVAKGSLHLLQSARFVMGRCFFLLFLFFFFSYTLGFYRDHQWPLDRGDGGKVLDIRGGIQGELKNGAKVVFDPDLGNVVSLEASEGWLLMGDFKGIYFLSHPIT